MRSWWNGAGSGKREPTKKMMRKRKNWRMVASAFFIGGVSK
jgi:hypothetical protein